MAYPAVTDSDSGRPLRAVHARASEDEQLGLLYRASLDALLVVDDARRIVRVNDAAERLYRLPADEIIGRQLDEFSPPEHFGILVDLWSQFESDGVQEGHYEVLRGDGSRTMVEYRAIRDFGRGQHLIAVRQIAGSGGLKAQLWARRAQMGLSPRELQVLQHVAEGRSAPEIADELFVSPGTVKTHLKNIYGKLGARDRASAVALALRRGLIE